jgi:hypothetical protein
MAEPHVPRPSPRPTPQAHAPRSKPDPNPLRLMVGLAGLASASAITSAMLPSVLPQPATTQLVADLAPVPEPSVIHVTKTVVLQPGQTPPPQASVIVPPTPSPRVHIVTTTRQSGRP